MNLPLLLVTWKVARRQPVGLGHLIDVVRDVLPAAVAELRQARGAQARIVSDFFG
jgi:hypothetical protein